MTNADKIRSMTNEQLAEWFCCGRECGDCPYSWGCHFGFNGMLEWLEKESET